MHYENSKALLRRPPLVPNNMSPEVVYSGEKIALLKIFLKATLHCTGKEDFEKAVKGFSDKERAEVAKTLSECRSMGYYPEAVIDNEIRWGIALKGDVEIEMERNAKRYFDRGVQVKKDGFTMKSMDESIAAVEGKTVINEFGGKS